MGIYESVTVSVTRGGCEEHGLIMDCVTVPGDPQDVAATSINSTAIRVKWKPPKAKDQNGVIRGYHIHVQEVREEVSWRAIDSSSLMKFSGLTYIITTTITIYRIELITCNFIRGKIY